MLLYHATPLTNLPSILAQGLLPDAPGKGVSNQRAVFLHASPYACRDFVAGLYRCPVVVLEVDVTGLTLVVGDDDDEFEFACPDVIEPVRLVVPY